MTRQRPLFFDQIVQSTRIIFGSRLGTGQCDFEGEFYKIHGLHLRPQPDRDLSENLWCAGGTPDTVQLIAKHGVRPLTIPTTSLELALSNMRSYAELRDKAGHGPSHTKLALWTYVGETASEAEAGARQYMCEYADSALRHYELLGTHLEDTKGYKEYGQLQKALRQDAEPFRQAFYRSHPWGTPDQVIKRTSELAQAFGTDEIMFVFKYGSMPMAATEKSMRLFAKEVMPALRDLSPEPLTVNGRTAEPSMSQQHTAK